MATFPYRLFHAKIDILLDRVPTIGKILSFVFGAFEYLILEAFRFLDIKLNINTIKIVNRYIIKSRWGGKVIPLNVNLDLETKFLPSQEILSLLSRSKVTGISNCYCRETQRKHSDTPNCDHPIKTCIHIGFGKSLREIPYKSENLIKVSKRDIKQLLEESDRRGLVHQIIYFPNPMFYYVVCNCCPCCCVIMNKFLTSGSPQMIKSDFIAFTDLGKCNNCGFCVEYCNFGARIFNNEKLTFLPDYCFGCGLCVSKCPEKAIILRKKSKF
ncbi:MAG: 4Fe-4S binding protein [Candidatus Lokiarchaeota archaeon]|nr:4Fe-4S binding protein [Candidatus Lokiarchaeota archaeon]